MRIVVGVSGSPACAGAVRAGWEAAVAHDAPLHVLGIWEAPAVPDYAGLGHLPDPGVLSESTRASAEQLVAEATVGLPGAPRVTVDTLCGSAGPALVASVGAEDRLYVGGPRPGRLHRLIPGSVASYLLNHAPCPVTVVPCPEHELVTR